MAEVGSVVVRIGAETAPFEQSIAKATRLTEAFGATAQRLGSRLSGLGGVLSLSVTVPIVALGSSLVSAATEMDSLTRGLTAMTGSASQTQVQLARLQDVAKLPGLGFREAIQGSINLQAAGFSALMAENSLKAFGNALATVGRGKDDLNGVILALTQIVSLGKVTADNINQISNRVPQMRQAMVAAFGTADTEALQKRHLSVQAFVQGITAELAKLPQVTGGARNSFENLEDASFRLRAALGAQILPILTPLVSKFADFAQSLSNVNPAILGLGVRIAGAAAVAGPLLFVVGKIVGSLGSLLPALSAVAGFLTGPWGIAIGIAAAGALAISTNFLGIGDAAREAWKEVARVMAAILPPTLALMHTWVNNQIGYFVGLGRAAGVVFGEIGTQYEAMQRRLQPVTSRLAPVTSRITGALRSGAASSLGSVEDLVHGNSRLFGTGRFADPATRAQRVITDATAPTEAAARSFSQRVADAFNSGFGRDFVGEAGDALQAAIARMTAALSERGSTGGGLLSSLRDLAAGAATGGGAHKALADLTNDFEKLTDAIKSNGDAWKTALRFVQPSAVGPLPQHLQRMLELGPRNVIKQDADAQKARDLSGKGGDKIGGFVAQLGQGISGMLAQFGPVGLAMEAIGAVLKPLQPLLDALLVPFTIMGEILSSLIVPVLRVLFQPLKMLGIVVSYIGEVIAKVAGAIATAIGSLVRGIGRLVNKLPGSPGDPLVKAGQAMIDLGNQFKSAAKDMAEKRKELEGLSFDDALNNTADAANKLSEALINAAEGFKIERFRFAASDAEHSSSGAIPRSPPGPRTDQSPGSSSPALVVDGGIQIFAAPGEDPEDLWDRLLAVIERRALANPHQRAVAAGLA